MRDRILLIDAMNMIHRSNIKFKSKTEEPSFTIVYNFFRSLRALIEEFNPNKVFFCLEGENNFRYKLFSDYKSSRFVKEGVSVKKTRLDDSFLLQANSIIELLSYLPITTVKADGFEADDVIATLAENLKDEDVIVISNDSDYIQLLQKSHLKNLKLYDPIKKAYVSSPKHFYFLWKCLAGDKSDDIPGIVSDQEAIDIASNPSKLQEFLTSEERASNFRLNRELIELRIIDGDKLVLVEGNSNFEKLRETFEMMQFNSMFKGDYWGRFVKTFGTLR